MTKRHTVNILLHIDPEECQVLLASDNFNSQESASDQQRIESLRKIVNSLDSKNGEQKLKNMLAQKIKQNAKRGHIIIENEECVVS